MRKKEEQHKINQYIRVPSVRIVGDNIDSGIYDTKFALNFAQDLNLDLVEISPGNPPVCKIIDYQKFLYDKRKKEKEQKKKQKANQIQIKEIRLTPNIDEHDFNFKLKHAQTFLNDNNRIVVSVFFKGREITYKEKGEIILLKFFDAIKDYGIAENLPKLEGKRMLMTIKPKKL